MNDIFYNVFSILRKQRFNEAYAKILLLYHPIVLKSDIIFNWNGSRSLGPYTLRFCFTYRKVAGVLYMSFYSRCAFNISYAYYHYFEDGAVSPGRIYIGESAGSALYGGKQLVCSLNKLYFLP
jgi:hypothetical protein